MAKLLMSTFMLVGVLLAVVFAKCLINIVREVKVKLKDFKEDDTAYLNLTAEELYVYFEKEALFTKYNRLYRFVPVVILLVLTLISTGLFLTISTEIRVSITYGVSALLGIITQKYLDKFYKAKIVSSSRFLLPIVAIVIIVVSIIKVTIN